MSEDRKREPRFSGQDAASTASRARNRTVLLSPETIGQVRASLAEEESTGQDPVNELLPPMGWDTPQEAARSVREEAPPEQLPPFSGTQHEPPRTFSRFQPPAGAAPTRPAAGWAQEPAPRQSKSPSAPMVRPPHQEAHAAPFREAPVREAPRSKIVGFLISFDADENGEVSEVRSGRWLVTSRPTDHQDYILIDDQTVSPLHAIIRATSEGKVQVLDQLSEHGTGVTRVGEETEEEVAGAMTSIGHGDVVRFGRRKFVLCLVPKTPSKVD